MDSILYQKEVDFYAQADLMLSSAATIVIVLVFIGAWVGACVCDIEGFAFGVWCGAGSWVVEEGGQVFSL